MRILLNLACVVAALAMLVTPATALTTITSVDMAANFDGGNTSGHPDGFPGMASSTWSGSWGEWYNKTADAPYTNYLVRTSDETPGTYDDDYAELTPGSGNYLYADVNVSGSTGGSGGFERNYAGRIGVDLAQPYSIDFLYRVEEDATSLASRFTTSNDRYSLFDYPTARTGITTGCGWVIAAHGGTASWMDKPGKWLFFNGQGHLGDVTNTPDKWVDSGIAISAGQTLSFHLDIDPVNKKWDATITDLADPSNPFTQTGMGWRIDTTVATGDPNATLSGLTQFKGQGDAANDERQFSIDSLHIQQSSCLHTVGGMSTVAARFNDGETDLATDGFVGMVGDGWNSAWSTRGDRAILNTAVQGSFLGNELHAGTGNYLEMTVDNMEPGSVGYSIGGVTRDYARVNEAGIDWTKDHTIEFSVRIDEDVTPFFSNFTELNDKYQIFDQTYSRGGINGETSWGAYVDGLNHYWSFLDGSDSVVSTIEASQGTVYDFTIDIDADSYTYDVTLSNGSNTFTIDGLSWRNQSDAIGGFLNFMARGDSADDIRAWSIDEIVISQESAPVPGDADGDGDVDEADAGVLADNWGRTDITGGAADGDFNGDGSVGLTDASILAGNWTGSSEGTAVPEPGSLLMIGLGVLMLAAVRRRKH